MTLTNEQRRKMDNMSPETKGANIGSAVGNIQDEIGEGVSITGADFSTPIFITYTIAADASSGLDILCANCPFPIIIEDVIIEARATSGGGTVTLSNGSNDITDAMVCAVDTTIVRAGTINDAYSTIPLNGTIDVTTNGAADRAKITIVARRDN